VFDRFDRLVGDAARSPVTRRFGTADQFTAGVGVTYSFRTDLPFAQWLSQARRLSAVQGKSRLWFRLDSVARKPQAEPFVMGPTLPGPGELHLRKLA
jgi:MltA-interacting protein MipA